MKEETPQRIHTSQAIFAMWRNWTEAVGALTLPTVLSLFVTCHWMPVVLLSLAFILFVVVRVNHGASLSVCKVLHFIASRSLLWSGIVALIISLTVSTGNYERFFGFLNADLPYVVVLVTSPVALIVSGWAILRGLEFGYCMDCRMRHGTPAERGFIGRMFSQEGWFQIRFLFWLMVVQTALGYGYYFVMYINAGLSTSDIFVFVWVPLVFYCVSIVFMAVRYFNIYMYYEYHYGATDSGRGAKTSIRYLIVCGEQIMLERRNETMGEFDTRSRYDTPASLSFFFYENMPIERARKFFADYSGIENFDIRFMYNSTTSGGDSNSYHYIITLPDAMVLRNCRLKGRFFNMREIEKLIDSGEVTPILAAEIYRLYTVGNTWSTYDKTGRRRYEIKGYRPAFRLKGIQNWDVDFNDPEWLFVSVNNQDSSFWMLRRYWHHFIIGRK